LLKDGRVLVTVDLGTEADIYDPMTGKFSPTGSMAVARTNDSVTLLPDGRVLIAGGETSSFNALDSAEIYDPASGTFRPTGSMTTARTDQSATLLPDGRVLIAGGASSFSDILDSAETYDPATGAFSPAGSMLDVREDQTATPLSDGRVLIVGGLGAATNGNQPILATAELFEPKTGQFSNTGSMASSRYEHAATMLLDGRVLITGGSDNSGTLTSAEVYDPKTGAFGPAN